MKKVRVTGVLLSICLCVLQTSDAWSIPAFARKYQISCQVCHAPAMPRLKDFGNEFAGNGFRLVDYESPRYYIPVGDDKLSLFRELPLAFRLDGFVLYNPANEKRTHFSSPFVLKLLSGGEISERISYYFYFLLNERGSVAGIEDAFLIYHNLLGTGVNFYIGQFQASDPLYKSELRYTLEPYRIYEARPGNATASLKYDRGIILDKSFKTGTSVVFQLLNGNGIGDAGEEFAFDKDKYKNMMIRLIQTAGHISIGAFGYYGKETIFLGVPSGVNTIWMAGPDVSFNYEDKIVVNLQYLIRNDSDVTTEAGVQNDVKTRGGFAEIIFSPKGDMSNWYLTGLINLIDSDDDAVDYSSATLHAGYLLRRNVRVVAEYTQRFKRESYGLMSAGFVTAF